MELLRKVPGPLYGYRSWRIRQGLLTSYTFLFGVWPFHEPIRAVCPKSLFFGKDDGDSPHPGCSCGIYAYRNIPQERFRMRHGVTPVWGVVELSGKIVAHSRGYRAQFARPVALVHEEGLPVAEVAQKYGAILLEDLREWKRLT